MRREIGPQATAAFEEAVQEAVRDAEAPVAYADSNEESPSGYVPPWWHGDEEASQQAMGWATRAQTVSGIQV